MFFITLLKIVSILAAIVCGTFVIPVITAVSCGETYLLPAFLIPMAVSIVFFLVINIFFRKIKYQMSVRQTFLIVALSWIAASVMASIPMYFCGAFGSYANSFFESVSGFTTTGATILSDVDSVPRSINMLRCLTHWLGGMGIVTLTVALLPLLGVGGFQLIKAETTGPEKGKVTARITTTAKILWLIYSAFTIIETVLLKIAGMDFADALAHSFATLGTGGFSVKSASIGAYNSVAIDIIITVFMFLAGINFSLYYYMIQRNFREVKNNSELKVYIGIVVFFVLMVTISLLKTYGTFGKSLRYASFQVMSLLSTTGFATADYVIWPTTTQFWLFILFFIGGCSGSTAGGVKVIRWIILSKQLNNETKQMIHPHGVFSVRLNNKVGRKDIVFNVSAFIVLYLILVAVTTFVGCIGKLDLYTAFTGALSMVGNVGPAFGALGPSANYGFLPSFVKYWYCFAMLAGRLELYTMLIFVFPSYWKK